MVPLVDAVLVEAAEDHVVADREAAAPEETAIPAHKPEMAAVPIGDGAGPREGANRPNPVRAEAASLRAIPAAAARTPDRSYRPSTIH